MGDDNVDLDNYSEHQEWDLQVRIYHFDNRPHERIMLKGVSFARESAVTLVHTSRATLHNALQAFELSRIK